MWLADGMYYSQEMVMPEVLYDEVVEVEERVVLHQEACQLGMSQPLLQGTTGEKVCYTPSMRPPPPPPPSRTKRHPWWHKFPVFLLLIY